MKPDRYPLPWCDALDRPYHAVNMWLILHVPDWREKQSGVPMRTIIGWIDAMVADGTLEVKQAFDGKSEELGFEIRL